VLQGGSTEVVGCRAASKRWKAVEQRGVEGRGVAEAEGCVIWGLIGPAVSSCCGYKGHEVGRKGKAVEETGMYRPTTYRPLGPKGLWGRPKPNAAEQLGPYRPKNDKHPCPQKS